MNCFSHSWKGQALAIFIQENRYNFVVLSVAKLILRYPCSPFVMFPINSSPVHNNMSIIPENFQTLYTL